MIRILDDILLVAKGSYSLNITEQSVDLSQFLQETVTDMQNFAYMEGVSVRIRKEDIIHKKAASDFNRIRQVIHSKCTSFRLPQEVQLGILGFRVKSTRSSSCFPLHLTNTPFLSLLSSIDLVSNAIKFSEEDINIELLQRKSFSEGKCFMRAY